MLDPIFTFYKNKKGTSLFAFSEAQGVSLIALLYGSEPLNYVIVSFSNLFQIKKISNL